MLLYLYILNVRKYFLSNNLSEYIIRIRFPLYSELYNIFKSVCILSVLYAYKVT